MPAGLCSAPNRDPPVQTMYMEDLILLWRSGEDPDEHSGSPGWPGSELETEVYGDAVDVALAEIIQQWCREATVLARTIPALGGRWASALHSELNKAPSGAGFGAIRHTTLGEAAQDRLPVGE